MKFVLCGRRDETAAECIHESGTPCCEFYREEPLMGQEWGLYAIAANVLR